MIRGVGLELEVTVLAADDPWDEELAILRGVGVENAVGFEVGWGFRLGAWRGKGDVEF